MADAPRPALRRELRTGGAVLLGLGSMVGTGVFISLGLGAGLVGPGVVLAVALAGGLAMCNGLSSAQLAAAFPVSGGTYEYGHRVGWAPLGTVAGVLFIVAKSASAATAALGLAGYVIHRFGWADPLAVPGAIAVVICLTVVVLEGIRRTNRANAVIVGVTLLGLLTFIFGGLTAVEPGHFTPFFVAPDDASVWSALPHAAALMFVAYTGYGRIATLGEEVHDPRRTIPRAIVITVVVCVLLYAAVAAVAVGVVGAPRFAALSTLGDGPLKAVAEAAGLHPLLVWVVTLAAVTAMLGVILNLILGLSRVALSMGRRGHLPRHFATVDATGSTPGPAVLLVAGLVVALACLGSIERAWSLSAVTVLIYYAITNAAALRLAAEHRLYPRVFSWLGLLGCLGLAVWIDWPYLVVGAAVVVVALAWHTVVAMTRSE